MSSVPDVIVTGRHWVSAMPDAVAGQRRLLDALMVAVEPDARWRWLELSCSLARGAGDALSDIDAGLGVRDEDYEAVLAQVPNLLAGLGPMVGLLDHDLGWSGPHRRFFVQYDGFVQDDGSGPADHGVQLDLVVVPATFRTGLPPGAVALLDRDGRLATSVSPRVLRAREVDRREWAFLGWAALADATKYLTRGSLWEAHDRIETARQQVWRLVAAAADVDYPMFGITSLLDDGVALPPPAERTVVPLQAEAVASAANLLADLLTEAAGEAHPADFAEFTRARMLRPGSLGAAARA
jgi:hypothetical protein